MPYFLAHLNNSLAPMNSSHKIHAVSNIRLTLKTERATFTH